jgi:Ca2+-binding RTX toxin-like protein
MKKHRLLGAQHLGIAATAAFGVGLLAAGTGPAGAAQTVSATVANNTLFVTGTNQSDQIALLLAPGEPGTLQVDVGADGTPDHSFDRNTFNAVAVDLRGGSDRLVVLQANGAFADEALTVFAGSGADDIVTGDEVDVIHAGPGGDTIDAGGGDDHVFSEGGNDRVDGGRGNDTASLGAGQDSFQWDPGEGSDTVDGDQGTDTMVFNGANIAEKMAFTANGPRLRFTRDIANITMDVDGTERFALHALGGADEVTVNDLTGTDLRRADIDLAAAGGAGDGAKDVVTVSGTDARDRVEVDTDGPLLDVDGLRTQTRIAGAESTDQLQINTLDGNDKVTVDGNVFGRIAVGVDLGNGQI